MLINTKKKKVFIYNRKLKLYTAKRNYFTLIPFFKDDTDIKIKHMCKIEHRYKLCLTTQTRFSLDKKTAKNEMKKCTRKTHSFYYYSRYHDKFAKQYEGYNI